MISIGEWMGLAFLLPCATFIGYAVGHYMDRWLGTTYLYIVFTLLGIAAGLAQVIRQFLKESK